jgi:hypothetical protein
MSNSVPFFWKGFRELKARGKENGLFEEIELRNVSEERTNIGIIGTKWRNVIDSMITTASLKISGSLVWDIYLYIYIYIYTYIYRVCWLIVCAYIYICI